MSYLKNISHISYYDDINHHKLSYDNIGFWRTNVLMQMVVYA